MSRVGAISDNIWRWEVRRNRPPDRRSGWTSQSDILP